MNKKQILFFLLLLSTGVFAEIIHFRADKITYRIRGKKEIVCIGNAVISNTNILIKAYKIVIFGDDLDVAKCYKNVYIENYKSEVKLKSQYLEFYKKKDYIRLLESPVLESKGLRIKGDSLERENKIPLSIVQGNVHISKTNVDIYCSEGQYDEKKDIIYLRGQPEVKVYHKGGEDQYYCGNIIFDNKNNSVIFSKNIQGIVYFNE